MDSTGLKLIFRADADSRIGTGHVMRCLALAQACRDYGGHGAFVLSLKSPALEERLEAEGMEVVRISPRPGSAEDASQTELLARKFGADWLVVDGYHFGEAYQRAVMESGAGLLFIDDNGHAGRYIADLVLNQNLHAREELYAKREPSTRLLLGTPYVLLRREFSPWRGWKRQVEEAAGKLLVTLGGADPENATAKVLRGLARTGANGLEAVVVAGPSNPNLEELGRAVREADFPVRLETNVADMPKLMAWADLAVSSGGTTSWEMAFMGLPCIIILLAKNQEEGVRSLAEKRAFLSLGYAGEVGEEEIGRSVEMLLGDARSRLKLSRNCSRLVDGLGPERVLRALFEAGEGRG